MKTPATPEMAKYYQTIETDNDRIHFNQKIYTIDGHLVQFAQYIDKVLLTADGNFEMYAMNGAVWKGQIIKDGQMAGYYTKWPNGRFKREEAIVNDKVVSCNCHDENGVELACGYSVNTEPKYPGGNEALFDLMQKNYRNEMRYSGSVTLSFYVEENGDLKEIKVERA